MKMLEREGRQAEGQGGVRNEELHDTQAPAVAALIVRLDEEATSYRV